MSSKGLRTSPYLVFVSFIVFISLSMLNVDGIQVGSCHFCNIFFRSEELLIFCRQTEMKVHLMMLIFKLVYNNHIDFHFGFHPPRLFFLLYDHSFSETCLTNEVFEAVVHTF